MKQIIAIVTVLIFAVSCGNPSTSENVPAIDATITEVVKTGNPQEQTIELSIEGMMCEIACAGKIRKELSQVAGVSETNVDYQDNRALDLAMVTYDPAKTTPEELINTVQAIADGEMYHVKAAEVTVYQKTEAPESNTSDDDSATMSIDFQFPGITDIIRSFLPV